MSKYGEHFIREIEIKNFKCFDEFKAEGFGRVNLIGGKNNVGKTAFMEALLCNTNLENNNLDNFIDTLISIKIFRNYDFLYELSEASINEYVKIIISLIQDYFEASLKTNINNININLVDDSLKIKLNEKEYSVEDFNSVYMNSKIDVAHNFISSILIASFQLEKLYDGVKINRKREEINIFLQSFDRDLIEYDFINDKPVCFSKKLNKFIDIDLYGNGLKRYLAYTSAIWANKDKYIFIDEIENGIHYTNLDKLWEIILKISKEANVQVFATTHSKECIESYARVAKKLKDDEITYIQLKQMEDNSIKAGVYDSEVFINAIEQDHEVRGW